MTLTGILQHLSSSLMPAVNSGYGFKILALAFVAGVGATVAGSAATAALSDYLPWLQERNPPVTNTARPAAVAPARTPARPTPSRTPATPNRATGNDARGREVDEEQAFEDLYRAALAAQRAMGQAMAAMNQAFMDADVEAAADAQQLPDPPQAPTPPVNIDGSELTSCGFYTNLEGAEACGGPCPGGNPCGVSLYTGECKCLTPDNYHVPEESPPNANQQDQGQSASPSPVSIDGSELTSCGWYINLEGAETCGGPCPRGNPCGVSLYTGECKCLTPDNYHVPEE